MRSRSFWRGLNPDEATFDLLLIGSVILGAYVLDLAATNPGTMVTIIAYLFPAFMIPWYPGSRREFRRANPVADPDRLPALPTGAAAGAAHSRRQPGAGRMHVVLYVSLRRDARPELFRQGLDLARLDQIAHGFFGIAVEEVKKAEVDHFL